MNARGTIPEADRALKSLFRELVRLVGGLDASATCVRVGRSQLASYYDMGCDLFAPVDVVAALEVIAGVPLVTAELARRAGHALIPLDLRGEGELSPGMGRLGREAAEAFAVFVEAGADGRVTLDEVDAQIREHQDLVRAAQANLAILTRMRTERA